VLDLPVRHRRRGAAEIGLRVAVLSPARRVAADSKRRVPGGKKRSSYFAATRTHWKERPRNPRSARFPRLRPAGRSAVADRQASAGYVGSRERPDSAQASAIRQVEHASSATLRSGFRREHAGRHGRGGTSRKCRTGGVRHTSLLPSTRH
jgi:hypothetical protein